MLYDGWLGKIAKRFQEEFDRIEAVYNFDPGPEFEIAICEVLRKLLPQRFGICRGFVIGRDGRKAGDDIIIFDANRFPTIRGLLGLARKEGVPAEAVLAYIEAKHTLYAVGEEKTKQQSLVKASRQVESVKTIPRERNTFTPSYKDIASRKWMHRSSEGLDHCNPFYGAVWARTLVGTAADVYRQLPEIGRASGPDVIVAGSTIVLPGVSKDGFSDLRPFLGGDATLGVSESVPNPFGIALAHLIWAIEQIQLGDLPWPEMIIEALAGRRIFHAVKAAPADPAAADPALTEATDPASQ